MRGLDASLTLDQILGPAAPPSPQPSPPEAGGEGSKRELGRYSYPRLRRARSGQRGRSRGPLPAGFVTKPISRAAAGDARRHPLRPLRPRRCRRTILARAESRPRCESADRRGSHTATDLRHPRSDRRVPRKTYCEHRNTSRRRRAARPHARPDPQSLPHRLPGPERPRCDEELCEIISPSPWATEPITRKPSGKIKVGLISQYFVNHTIGTLNRGLVEKLDRSKFHVTVLSRAPPTTKRAAFTSSMPMSSCCCPARPRRRCG